jgi:four helix bundle protein
LKTFEELECWKRAAELRRELSVLVKSFPVEEKYKLVDQIVRASRSATANIAEGYGRFHYQEFIQYCRQSRGSLFELIDHLIVAEEERYISKEDLVNFKSEIQQCCAILNGFINYLQKAKVERNIVKEPELQYENSTTDNC